MTETEERITRLQAFASDIKPNLGLRKIRAVQGDILYLISSYQVLEAQYLLSQLKEKVLRS